MPSHIVHGKMYSNDNDDNAWFHMTDVNLHNFAVDVSSSFSTWWICNLPSTSDAGQIASWIGIAL